MGAITNAPAVMLWRRVSNLGTAEKTITKTLTWPKVGGNDYAVVSDAGNLLVGQWVPAQLAAGSGCSGLDLLKIDFVSNPAGQLVVASQSLALALTQLRALTKLPVKPSGDSPVSFVDENGNFTRLMKSTSGTTGRSAKKLSSLMKAPLSVAPNLKNVAVGYELLVTDIKASTAFYKNVLGLKLLDSTKSSVSFDLGNMILTLRPETALGLVRSLNRAGRLGSDWIVFQVKDIEAAVKALKAKGVKFPKGIEDSVHGRGAYFTDPDGFSYGLWLPPTKPDAINYFPQLHRIVNSTKWLV
jgi:predicted enzyme related to lactoylglutathione lyase